MGFGIPARTHHALYDLVLAVVFLHLEQVIAEVQDVEAPLLAQQGDDDAAGPVQPVSETLPAEQNHSEARVGLVRKAHGVRERFGARPVKHSLHGELVSAHRDAVHELHGAPQPVELHALVHVHDAVAG